MNTLSGPQVPYSAGQSDGPRRLAIILTDRSHCRYAWMTRSRASDQPLAIQV